MLTGYYLGIKLQELEEFTAPSQAQLKTEAVQLDKISIFDNPVNKQTEIHFDYLPGEGYWGGYVKGYLYKDLKFHGWFHFVTEAKLPVVKLIGTYKHSETGIELRGSEEEEGKPIGAFFIQLKDSALSNKIVTENKTVKDTTTKYESIFTKKLANQLTIKANKQKDKTKKPFNHYKALLNIGLNPDSTDHFILAASAAYSWMPTMLELFPSDPGNMLAEINAVQKLGAIQSISDFEKKEDQISEWLQLLTSTINHSVVGASKTLHLFYPHHIPILDRRVLKAWQKLFGKHYKKHPALKLASSVPYASDRQVPLYMKYWKLMLQWKENSGVSSIRELEESLYWLGGSI